MKFIGNIIWLLLGGLTTAIEYFVAGLALCITIIGIPFGVQCFKMAMLMLWPFGSQVSESRANIFGCVGNILWIVLAGWIIALTHLLYGVVLCITIIGLPFGMKHFSLAKLAFTPFGRDITTTL